MINPLFQLIAASGTLFAVTLGREVVQGFLARLLSGRILQAMGFLMAIGLAVGLGGQWVLGRFGQTVNGVVNSKREVIAIQRDGSWSRTTELITRYNAGKHNGALDVTVPVSPSVYDVAPVGRAVPLRCMPLYQTLCLLKYDSVAEWEARRLMALAGGRESLFLLGLGLAVFWLGFAEWDATKPGQRWLGRLLFGAWSLTLLYLTARPSLPGAPQGVLVRSQARVTSLRPFTSYEFLDPLPLRYAHPFVVVQLGLLPAPGRDAVVAVDAVDQTAAMGIRVGTVVPVVMPPGDPRSARLADATRTFVQGNIPKELGLTVLLLALVVGPVLLVELLRRPPAGVSRQRSAVGGQPSTD